MIVNTYLYVILMYLIIQMNLIICGGLFNKFSVALYVTPYFTKAEAVILIIFTKKWNFLELLVR